MTFKAHTPIHVKGVPFISAELALMMSAFKMSPDHMSREKLRHVRHVLDVVGRAWCRWPADYGEAESLYRAAEKQDAGTVGVMDAAFALQEKPPTIWPRYSRGELLARLGHKPLSQLSAIATNAERITDHFTAN